MNTAGSEKCARQLLRPICSVSQWIVEFHHVVVSANRSVGNCGSSVFRSPSPKTPGPQVNSPRVEFHSRKLHNPPSCARKRCHPLFIQPHPCFQTSLLPTTVTSSYALAQTPIHSMTFVFTSSFSPSRLPFSKICSPSHNLST